MTWINITTNIYEKSLNSTKIGLWSDSYSIPIACHIIFLILTLSKYPSFFLSHLIKHFPPLFFFFFFLLSPLSFQTTITAHAATVQQCRHCCHIWKPHSIVPFHPTAMSHRSPSSLPLALPFKALHCCRRLSHLWPFTHVKPTMVSVITFDSQHSCHLHSMTFISCC